MQTAPAYDAHVNASHIAYEVMDYWGNVTAANSDDSDFGDRCYYSDRADDNLARLRALGAHDEACALSCR